MAYQSQRQPTKKNPNGWRVKWRKYKKDPTSGEYKPVWAHVPATEYARLGIKKDMTKAEVDAILHKLNLDGERTRREDQRQLIEIRVASEKEIDCRHLPTVFVEKFELEHLTKRYTGNEERLAKVLKLWRTSQRIIRTVKESIGEWHRYPEPFYAHFQKNAVSPGHAKNILSTINMWLDFLGMEQDKHYRPIPAPNSYWQSRINDAFEDSGKSKESLPITPDKLASISTPMPNESQYNWLYCSIWAGLRPDEVDHLTDPKRTNVRMVRGTPILGIYQAKLKNIPDREARWKYIPLFLPEQEKILQIIKSGNIETPLCKTLADRLGKGHTLYGGRKGFHDLMFETHGQDYIHVSMWLGHKSLQMTQKNYAKKDAVSWTPKKKAA